MNKESTAVDLALRGTDNLDPSSNGEVCSTARISALARLAHPASERARGLLVGAGAEVRDLLP